MSKLYIRYAVSRPGQSTLCAQYTPRYFNERQLKQAEKYAKSIGSHVVDLFKEIDDQLDQSHNQSTGGARVT